MNVTTLKDALNTAGLRIPLNRRLWMWVQDHPGASSKSCAAALKASAADTSATLADMYARSMVARQQRPTHNKAGCQFEYVYTTLGKTFELLPKPKKEVAPKAKVTPIKALEPMVIVPAVQPVSKIDSMTVREARALYNELRALFGGTK